MGDIDNHQRGVLHMAVEGDFPTILSVLLEHAADPDLIDEGENTGRLHHYDIINQALILCLSAALLFVLFVVVYCLSPPQRCTLPCSSVTWRVCEYCWKNHTSTSWQ